jgi:hypothetical protein
MGLVNIDMDQYAELPHMNQSTLKNGLKSMRHLTAAVNGEIERKETDALAFGSLVHSVVLEEELLTELYAVAPKVDRRTKGGKQEWEDFQKVNSDKTIVKQEDFQAAVAMREAVRSHPAAAALLKRPNQVIEGTAIWHDEDSGIDCKARLDCYIPAKGRSAPTVVDLKTTVDASPEGFAKSVAKWGYHVQQAFYLDGLAQVENRHAKFIFVAVEKVPPYAVGVYMIDDEAEETGRKLYKSILKRFADIRHDDRIPAYSDAVQTLSLPEWASQSPSLII